MKKLLTTAIIAAALLTSSHAAEKDKFQFGIRMGAQFSKLKGESEIANFESKNAKNLVGPAFGFIFEIPVHANFEIRPELNFGSQGQRFDLPADHVFSLWMGYVQVPVLFRGQFGSDKVRGFLQAGPQFGYGAFALSRLRKGSEKIEKESLTFDELKLKPFDAGISLGLGVEFPSVKGMELEVRYYGGLTDINDTGIESFKTKNQSLHLTLGFKF